MDIYSFLQIAGGVGLFLYGMKVLGQGLERLAGAGLEKTLTKLTNNRFKGLMLGIIVTAAIQSSSATNIMLVGFVNAGIIKFIQAIPVVLGASIGTTVTGQILRLGDLSSSGSTVLALLKPSSFAPVLICIGAFIILLSKKKRAKDIATLLLGFGILFFGMTTMEQAFEPLEESEAFTNLFTAFSNPFQCIAQHYREPFLVNSHKFFGGLSCKLRILPTVDYLPEYHIEILILLCVRVILNGRPWSLEPWRIPEQEIQWRVTI